MKKRFYFLSILILFLFNIENINALENNNQVYFYNNNGTSVNSVSTSFDSSYGESYAIFTTYANSYGGLLVYQLSSPLVKNHMYKLFVNVGAANDGGYARLSTKNYIGLGTNLSSATNSYLNNTIAPSFSQAADISTDKGRGLYFIFTANIDATFIAIPYTSQYDCTNCYQYSYGLEIEDVGNTTGLTSKDISDITNNQTTIIQNDITNLEEITTTINLIASDGPINILVNNAGITKDASFKKMTAEQWQAVINVNLTGTFNMCKAVTPYLIAAGSGKIVNLASASAHGQFGQANYSASKAGIIGLTKTLALELARYKINVNAISPGFTMTEMTSILPDNVKQKYFDTIPMGRGAEAAEIAYLVKFLSSEESNFITGNEILIDGGYKI